MGGSDREDAAVGVDRLQMRFGIGFVLKGERKPIIGAALGHNADFVAELARVYGYDQLKERLLPFELPEPKGNRSLELEERVRDLLADQGLQEAITYSLSSKEAEARVAALESAERQLEALRQAILRALAEGDRVGPHGQAADGVDIRREEIEDRLGDQQDPLRATRRLLDVDEPAAAPPGLQHEVAAAHGVFEKVVTEGLMLHAWEPNSDHCSP